MTDPIESLAAQLLSQSGGDAASAAAERARAARQLRTAERLEATKHAHVYKGRTSLVRATVNGERIAGPRVGTERFRFDPGDGDGERVFQYGDPIFLSERDLVCLRQSGYQFASASDPDPAGDTWFERGLVALENGDYHEAARVLRGVKAMPRDPETGNVDKGKPAVMSALGVWIDDTRGAGDATN